MRFDTIKWIEEFFERVFGNARARVGDFYFDEFISVGRGNIYRARISGVADGAGEQFGLGENFEFVADGNVYFRRCIDGFAFGERSTSGRSATFSSSTVGALMLAISSSSLSRSSTLPAERIKQKSKSNSSAVSTDNNLSVVSWGWISDTPIAG